MSKLKAARLKQELSQVQVAEGSGISQPHYCQIERGSRKPSYDVMVKIANLLGESVTDLFFGHDCSRKQQGVS